MNGESVAYRCIGLLAEHYRLGHMLDAGGGVFTMPDSLGGFSCRVSECNSFEDLITLSEWLNRWEKSQRIREAIISSQKGE